MILTQTPLRISLFGGGTDIQDYWRHQPGVVLGGAINKYMHVALAHRFDGRIRVCYSQTELVNHPHEVHHDIVRSVLTKVKLSGVDVASFSDVSHDGSGLGSSSSYCVGLVRAIYAKSHVDPLPDELVDEAVKIEIRDCHKKIGKQDHCFAAWGGVRRFMFMPDGSVQVCDIPRDYSDLLADHLLMFHIGNGTSRLGILDQEVDNIRTSQSTREALDKLAALAKDAWRLLRVGIVTPIGRMLDEAWRLKKTLADGISNDYIDDMYQRATSAGAVGGKVLGQGGGGYMIFFAPPDKHAAIIAAIPDATHTPFEWSLTGSKVVYHCDTAWRGTP